MDNADPDELAKLRAKERARYHERMANEPEFRDRLRAKKLAEYYKKKEILAAAGYPPRPVGRPRKYPDPPVEAARGI